MINELINKAMGIISEYCISDCDADCCKNGKTLKELGVKLNPCKYLINDRCKIYNERPTTCKNYPIRLDNVGVIINKCRVVEGGKIDEIIIKIKELNYKIYM